MLWSLVKILLFVALVAAITMAAGYVIEAGGEVRISVGSIELSLTPLAGMIATLLTLVAGWIVFRLTSLLLAIFRFFNGDETAISRYFDRNRERRGFEALADGLMALASGEGRVAMAKAAKAEKYLNRPDLTLLISAQAAEMSGETRKAQNYYKHLLSDDRTRFVGVQGILKQKLIEGDTETALKLAEKAFALRPRHEKTMDMLFSLQSEKQDWKGARLTLSAKLKARVLPKDVHTRRDAILALAIAREKIEAGDIDAGKSAAIEANHLSPDLIPAAVLTAEMHLLQGGVKAANKVLKKAWISLPHPTLAAAWAEIAPDETPAERRARFQPLLKTNPDHPETKMLASELAIVDQDFPGARKAMGDLADTLPTTRSLTIMAAIERGEGAPDNVVRGWLTRALDASRGPQWVCSSCNTIHKSWEPVCEHCTHFDTLNWQVPPKSTETPLHSTDMLPLIVGTVEKQAAIPPDESATNDEPTTEPAQNKPPQPPKSPTRMTAPPSENSEDLDGIIGDIHTIPNQPDDDS